FARRALQIQPENAAVKHTMGLVLFRNGSLGEADEISARRYFQRTVIARGYVLLVPRALDVVRYTSGRGTGWSHAARTDHPRDDIGFLARVLDHAEARFRIDRRRVVFAGQSDGGFLIWEIACHRPGLAAAYAVHAASYGGPLPERCAAPMRFLQAHGRRDRVVPFERARWRYGRLSAANPVEGLALLARANRCSDSKGKPVPPFHGFRRISWQGCARGAALDYLVHDGGHSYPWQWMPAVLDWFEGFDLSPPAVGQRTVRRAGERSGAFKAVPGRGAD
ncbi:MAG: prolyl oligopeptidase family serine peptidase, partial [Pseudomonadota bacterium]